MRRTSGPAPKSLAAAAATAGDEDELESAIRNLFKAYDIDESGELSRDEFLKIEMRLCFEKGEVFKEQETAKMTLADSDRSGQLSYQEFRDRQLRTYTEMGLSKVGTIEQVNQMARAALTERQKMGPRYHAGIRQALKKIFNLYDTSGDGTLSPEEWIAAQKVVAMEITDDIDEAWIDEAAFASADTNGDGAIQMQEFLDASFRMFEGVKQRTDVLERTLQRVQQALERKRAAKVQETEPVNIFVQAAVKPEFQPPSSAWQDEPTEDEPDKHASAWKPCGEVRLPLNLGSVEEVAALVRLVLQLDTSSWLSIFYCGPAGDTGSHPVTLLRGERLGEGNVQDALSYLSKPNAAHRLYVKNVRKRPTRLSLQSMAFHEEREGLLQKRTGQCWGLDWETQIVGDGVLLPPQPLQISLGDAVVVEVPKTDDSKEYTYVASVFMDKTDVLSKPVDENIEKKKPKKKKAAAKAEDDLLQFSFVALREGTCVLFVDVSWEDQEEKLATRYRLTTPVAENTVARIGPIQVEVVKPPPSGPKEKGAFVWWNGEKWSNKKGPAKKKGKKK